MSNLGHIVVHHTSFHTKLKISLFFIEVYFWWSAVYQLIYDISLGKSSPYQFSALWKINTMVELPKSEFWCVTKPNIPLS